MLQDGNTAAHHAARAGHKLVLHRLILAGTNLDVQNKVNMF